VSTNWQKANTPDEAQSLYSSWPAFGVLVETLNDDQIEHLKAGGYLGVYQGEYGLFLRYESTPSPYPHIKGSEGEDDDEGLEDEV
jgi:hypothetical protein